MKASLIFVGLSFAACTTVHDGPHHFPPPHGRFHRMSLEACQPTEAGDCVDDVAAPAAK